MERLGASTFVYETNKMQGGINDNFTTSSPFPKPDRWALYPPGWENSAGSTHGFA